MEHWKAQSSNTCSGVVCPHIFINPCSSVADATAINLACRSGAFSPALRQDREDQILENLFPNVSLERFTGTAVTAAIWRPVTR